MWFVFWNACISITKNRNDSETDESVTVKSQETCWILIEEISWQWSELEDVEVVTMLITLLANQIAIIYSAMGLTDK